MLHKAVNKQQKLLARKEELLNEIKYYDRRIEEVRSTSKNISDYGTDSSDSEIEFNIDDGPSLNDLKRHKSRLKTCLLATQELTELTVVKSEVTILVDPPTIDNEVTVTEEGTWREVWAECRVDLVPFNISFFTHQPSRKFAGTSFHGLSVKPTKSSHERELLRSVLPTLTAPSDAIEVLRSYAGEHRARRTTLSSLADKYGDCLYMERLPEGGFTVRCADLLQMSWALQNQYSPVAPFRHKMKFDLEYMDAPYIKAISQAHKALGDPALDADGRTLLLANIIDTCLEARRLMGPAEGSDVDALRQPSDQDSDVPAHSDQIMGPPKSLPKKSKRKDKENVATNHINNERNTIGDSSEAKKSKSDGKNVNSKEKVDITENTKNSNEVMLNEGIQGSANKVTKHNNPREKADKNSDSNEEVILSAKDSKIEIENRKKKTLKSKDIESLKKTKSIKERDSVQTKKVTRSLANDYAGENNKNLKTKASVDENEPKAKKSKMSVVNIHKTAEPTDTENIEKQNTNKMTESKSKDKIVKEKEVTAKNVKQIQNLDKHVQHPTTTETGKEKNAKENLKPEKTQQNPTNVENGMKKTENNRVIKLNTKESLKKTSNTNSELNIAKKSNNTPTLSERFKNKVDTNNIVKTSTNKNTNEGGIKNLLKNTEKSNNFKIDKLDKNALKSKLNTKNKELNQKSNLENPKIVKLNINNIQKVRKSLGLKKDASKNVVANKIITKIPQKKAIFKNLMTNPLRISPRGNHSKVSITQDSSKTSTGSNKHTNIPRLLKKPAANTGLSR